MRSLALLAAALVAGCTLYPEDSGPPDAALLCNTPGYATTAPQDVELVDPSTLACETFGQTACGPCELCPQAAPPPDWGACDSACRQLDQATCAQTSGCRVAYSYDAYWSMGTMGSASGYSSDFQGCYPVDTATPDPTTPCTQLGADACAASAACAALYDTELCNSEACTTRFIGCVPARQTVGACKGQVLCNLAVACPSGTTAGINGNCYTGSCIPDQFCGVPTL